MYKIGTMRSIEHCNLSSKIRVNMFTLHNRSVHLMRMHVRYNTLKWFLLFIIFWSIVFSSLMYFMLSTFKSRKLDWYFADGVLYPEPAREEINLFRAEAGDRILEQLMYVPPNYVRSNTKKKKILSCIEMETQQSNILFKKCPVNDCIVTTNFNEANTSDAVVFHDPPELLKRNNFEQIWIFDILESPLNLFLNDDSLVNWTATYRRDSDIVAPYGKWVYYDSKTEIRSEASTVVVNALKTFLWFGPCREDNRSCERFARTCIGLHQGERKKETKPTELLMSQVKEKMQNVNYAVGKSKKVAWFVSNCQTQNNRLTYALELQNYTSVDIYGFCGSLQCGKDNSSCFQLLQQYKFYLSFENSNCRDYITEKFFFNALEHNVVPIVMGPDKENYVEVAPKNSFIHVQDFKSPKDLADYINFLDTNDDAYNSYFKWKGTGELINTYFWCRVCAMLHSFHQPKFYKNLSNWFGGENICT